MKISKRRKVFPFYEHHGNLVYIGGVQRKLKANEEDALFRVLLCRKFNPLLKSLRLLAKKAKQTNELISINENKGE